MARSNADVFARLPLGMRARAETSGPAAVQSTVEGLEATSIGPVGGQPGGYARVASPEAVQKAPMESAPAEAPDVLEARGYGLGEAKGSGKYIYKVSPDGIEIVQSKGKKVSGVPIVTKDNPLYDVIMADIAKVEADPSLHNVDLLAPKKAAPKAVPAAERARVAEKPAPSAAPPSMAEPDITMNKPVAEDYADQLLEMPQGGALAEERNAAKPAMAGMGGRSGISKQIGEAMSSVGNFLEGTQMGKGAMARPMSTRVSEGAAAFDKAATATKMGTRPGISSEIKQAASGMIHAQKMRDAVTAASGALVRMDMSPMDANRVANQLAKANDLATLERLAKLK